MRVLVAFVLVLLLACVSPAYAQFNNGNVVTSAAGTANAQTGTVNNAQSYADLVYVPLVYTPAATNTGDTTLTLNSFGSSPHFRKNTAAGGTALTGSELINGQTYLIEYDGTYFQLLAPINIPVTAQYLTNSTYSFEAPVNLQLAASVGSNQLTVSVCTINSGSNTCNNASSTNPITAAFRDATIANGDPVIEQVTGALSFTIGSGNTMGCSNNTPCRLWLFFANNAGTVALCAYNANNGGTSVIGVNEANLQSSGSGTSGGSSAQTMYCSASSLSSVAVRYIGYLEATETTAGTWVTNPTKVQLFGPGIKKPGEAVEVLSSAASSLSISPSSNANLVRAITTSYCVTVGGASSYSISNTLKRGATTLLAVGASVSNNGSLAMNFSVPTPISYLDFPATISSTSYSLTGASCTLTSPYIILEEIMGSLVPANNNDLLGKVG